MRRFLRLNHNGVHPIPVLKDRSLVEGLIRSQSFMDLETPVGQTGVFWKLSLWRLLPFRSECIGDGVRMRYLRLGELQELNVEIDDSDSDSAIQSPNATKAQHEPR